MNIENFSISTLRKLRHLTLKNIADLSPEQLNNVPEGFNNNIIWNVAHLLAAQQNLIYLRSGQAAKMPMEFIQTYKPGTKPESKVSATEIENIKQQLIGAVDQLEEDLKTNLFDNYQGLTISLGIELNSIQESVSYLSVHEGLHLGYILALKRVQGFSS